MVLENIFTLFHAYSIYSIYLIKGINIKQEEKKIKNNVFLTIEYTRKRLLYAHLLEQH